FAAQRMSYCQVKNRSPDDLSSPSWFFQMDLATSTSVACPPASRRASTTHSRRSSFVAMQHLTSGDGSRRRVSLPHSTSMSGSLDFILPPSTRRPALLLNEPAAPSVPAFQKSAPSAGSPLAVSPWRSSSTPASGSTYESGSITDLPLDFTYSMVAITS